MVGDFLNAINKYKCIPGYKLSFPLADIDEIDHDKKEITLNFMGLCGVDSPLPECFIWQALHSQAWREFLTVFNSRLYYLFFRVIQKGFDYKNNFNSISFLENKVPSCYNLKKSLKSFYAKKYKKNNIIINISDHAINWVYVNNKENRLNNMVLGKAALDLSSKIQITIRGINLDVLLDSRVLLKTLVHDYLGGEYKADIHINFGFRAENKLGGPSLLGLNSVIGASHAVIQQWIVLPT